MSTLRIPQSVLTGQTLVKPAAIVKRYNGYYYVDETSNFVGPYNTEQDASEQYQYYVESLNACPHALAPEDCIHCNPEWKDAYWANCKACNPDQPGATTWHNDGVCLKCLSTGVSS